MDKPSRSGSGVFLLLALGLALSFEFVNGFHDTANAVATVIYTHTLKPMVAVVWSGCWNLIGVLTSSGAVAFGVLALLPVELVLNVGSGAGFAMVFALLISAIIWNLGHLVFRAAGLQLAHADRGPSWAWAWPTPVLSGAHVFGEGVNWAKASEVGMLAAGFADRRLRRAALLLLLVKLLIKRKDLYQAPEKDKAPPLWIRGLLVLTCTGVSFAHGSNDGQKGMGLIMLILIGILPADLRRGPEHQPGARSRISPPPPRPSRSRWTATRPASPWRGYQVAADELSAYLKTTGKVNDRALSPRSAPSAARSPRS